ncbi:MAG TPA: hypothetical protein VFE14_12380 [Micromonosporaceae bacterium]|nr:hypothetical protein [Micromonosporaceae bacterium]
MEQVLATADRLSPAVDEPAARRRRASLRDAIAVLALLAVFPVVHDIKNMLTAPYFLDEAWVALSWRFPISDLPSLTASTPLGWSLLLRLVPDADFLRVVPLAFHLIMITAAYAFGRLLAWQSAGTGVLAGVVSAAVVLLIPAQQVRHDLKQYTADAAMTLILLAVSAWIEASWSRRRLGALVGVAGVGMLLSHVTAIAAACVFGGLMLVALARRQRARAVETMVAGVVVALVGAAIYLGASANGRTSSLEEFWRESFPSLGDLPSYLWQRANGLSPLLGAQRPLQALIFAAFSLFGVLTIAKRQRPSTAVAIILLPVAAVLLGVARVYPLLDLRTSHFLLVAIAAVAGLGVVGAADSTAAFVRTLSPGWRTGLATAICAVVLVAFAADNRRWYRFDGDAPGVDYDAPMAEEDIRSAVDYVTAHSSPDDVIAISVMSSYGFAFYWQRNPIEVVRYGNAVGWNVGVPTQPNIVWVQSDNAVGIRQFLDQALDRAGKLGHDSRVWLIRSHVLPTERDAWQAALTNYQLELVTGGPEPVGVLTRK